MRTIPANPRNALNRALALASVIAIAIGSSTTAAAAPSDMAKAQQKVLKTGMYLAPDDSFRLAVPAELGKERWMREYHHVTDQLEVQFGDDSCRRYYLKKFGGAVGRAVAEDHAAKGSETTLRNVVTQLAAQRREDIASIDATPSRYGPAIVATSVTKRGWPCVAQFPEGGSTIGVAWLLVHQGALFEIGYQQGLSPGEDVGRSQAKVEQRAAAFVLGMELLDTATKTRFPFAVSDPPPRLAGLTLGDSRAEVEKVVGPVLEREGGSWEFEDEERGLHVRGSTEQGVEFLGIARREDGEVAGVRVGDRVDEVIAKWGPPASGGMIGPRVAMLEYSSGSWQLSVFVEKDKFSYLVLSAGMQAGSEESVPEAWPPAGAGKVRPDMRHVAKLPAEGDVHVGQRYELPASVLENHSGDSVHQKDPNVVVTIADVVASPPVLPGSAPAVDALRKLLGNGQATLEIVGVYTMGDYARSIEARVSTGGQDVAGVMVRDGWAIAVKGRHSDLALLSLEAQARTAKRGLWGISAAELAGGTPEEYLGAYLRISVLPETYWKLGASEMPLPALKKPVIARDPPEQARTGLASLRPVLAGDGSGLLGRVANGFYTAADGSFTVKVPALGSPDGMVFDRVEGLFVSVQFFSEASGVSILVVRKPKYGDSLRDELAFHSSSGKAEVTEIDTRYGPGLIARSEDTVRCDPSETAAGEASASTGCEDYAERTVSFIGWFGDNNYFVSVRHSDTKHPDYLHPHLVGGLSLEETARAMFDSIELVSKAQ